MIGKINNKKEKITMGSLLKHILTISFIALFLSSCSTLNQNECKAADWKTIGYTDGVRGYKASRIDKHRSACAEYKIQPNLDIYTKGRYEGLKQYCTSATAYKKGISGYNYNGVCSDHNEKIFLDAHNHGLIIYHAKNKLKKLEDKYAEEEHYIIQLERKLHRKEDRLVSGKLPKDKAIKVLNRTKEISQELIELKSHLLDLDNIIHNQTQYIKHLQNKI